MQRFREPCACGHAAVARSGSQHLERGEGNNLAMQPDATALEG
jgi:hypothetical protein